MDLVGTTHREKVVLVLAALSVVVLISFLPCLNNGFVNWDDEIYFVDNPLVKHLTWDTVRSIFLSYDRTQYSPVIFLAFTVEHHFFRLEPFGYHAVSLILHLINTWLVFWLFYLFRKNMAIAAGTALLFGIHPLRVESVAWVTEQKDLLYSLFFLGAFIGYIYYRNLSKKLFYFASLLLYLVSLTVKPMVIMFPVLLVCWELIYNKPIKKGAYLDKIPFFAVMMSLAVINWLAFIWEGQSAAIGGSWLSAFFRVSFYISKIFWPFHLSCLYPNVRSAFFTFEVATAPVLVAMVFLIGYLGMKDRKSFTFGALFFILILFPVLLPQRYFIVADRYVYLAGAGVFFCLVTALYDFCERRCLARTFSRAFFLSVVAAVIFLLATLTWRQSFVWRDGLSLWSQAARLYPEDPRIHNNLGIAYFSRKDYSNALIEATHFWRLEPTSKSAMQVGSAYFGLKNYERAKAFYIIAIRLNPGNAAAYNNLGLLYLRKPDEASRKASILWFKRALQVAVSFEDARLLKDTYQNLGQAYLILGEDREALKAMREAVRLNPDSAPSQALLLQALVQNKEFGEAIDVTERIMMMTPDDPWCYSMAAWLLERVGMTKEAETFQLKAEKLQKKNGNISKKNS